MRVRAPTPSLEVLLWFGLLGAPFGWALQLVFGFAVAEAGCGTARLGVAVDTLTLVATLLAAAVAVLATAASAAVFRATRESGEEPGPGRVHFLATIGLTISPLFLLIVLGGGLGAVVLPDCHQG